MDHGRTSFVRTDSCSVSTYLTTPSLKKLSSSSSPSSAKERPYAERFLMAAAEIPNTLNGKEKQTAAILADSYTDGYELVMSCCAAAALFRPCLLSSDGA
jgi:hypothetical protein